MKPLLLACWRATSRGGVRQRRWRLVRNSAKPTLPGAAWKYVLFTILHAALSIVAHAGTLPWTSALLRMCSHVCLQVDTLQPFPLTTPPPPHAIVDIGDCRTQCGGVRCVLWGTPRRKGKGRTDRRQQYDASTRVGVVGATHIARPWHQMPTQTKHRHRIARSGRRKTPSAAPAGWGQCAWVHRLASRDHRRSPCKIFSPANNTLCPSAMPSKLALTHGLNRPQYKTAAIAGRRMAQGGARGQGEQSAPWEATACCFVQYLGVWGQ